MQLKVEADGTEEPVGGLVEGRSAEKLFQSLARRCGVTVEKDPKVAHTYVFNAEIIPSAPRS